MAEWVWAKKNFRLIVMIATDKKVIWIWMFTLDPSFQNNPNIKKRASPKEYGLWQSWWHSIYIQWPTTVNTFSRQHWWKRIHECNYCIYAHVFWIFCYIRWLDQWLNRQPGKTWSTDLFAVHYRSITQACSDLQIHTFLCSKVLSTQVYWPKSLLGRKTSFCSPSCSLAESAVPPSAAVQTMQNWLRCEMTRLWHWMQTFQINDTSCFTSWIQQQVTNFEYTVHGLKLMVDSSVPE